MQGTTFKNLILGFVAGAIASATVGELIKYGLYTHGYVQTVPLVRRADGSSGHASDCQ